MENVLDILTTYEVNTHTMLISPQRDATHGICSFVKEVDKEFVVLQKPTNIIKRSCKFFGASYAGRVQGVKFLTGITHKPPIAVSPSNDIFFFPTKAATHHECVWVSHKHVENAYKAPQNKVEVHFSDGSSDTLNVSIRSFQNQFYRTAQVKSAYSKCTASQQESRQIDIVYGNEIQKQVQEKQGTKCLKFQIFIK